MCAARVKLLSTAVFVCCLWVLQNYLVTLEFDRQKILSGEIWRIWTGHLVHTNLSHFSLNIVAALIIYFTFASKIKFVELLLYGFIFSTLISVTLLSIYPSLDWYNGLSGLLHALVVYFSVRLAREERKIFLAGLIIIWIKVAVEMTQAHFGYENRLGEMTVITEAHFFGAFYGTIAAGIEWLLPSKRQT